MDWFLVAFVGFFVGLIGCLGLLVLNDNHTQWTETPNGCYIHTVDHRSMFREDYKVITELCPVGE